MLDPILSRLCIWWFYDLFLAQRDAAIINQKTLKAGIDGLMPHYDSAMSVINALENQITVIESILGITVND